MAGVWKLDLLDATAERLDAPERGADHVRHSGLEPLLPKPPDPEAQAVEPLGAGQRDLARDAD